MVLHSIMHARRHPKVRALAIAIGVGLIAAACGGTNYVYVKNPENNAFFRVPVGWTYYNKQKLLVASGLEDSPQAKSSFKWLVGYDSDPDPSVNHVIGGIAKHPVVIAQVQELSPQTRDQVSLGFLRNAVYPLDQLIQNDAADIMSSEEIVEERGLHGMRLIYNVSLGGNLNVAKGNQVLRVSQTALVDPGTKLMYVFVIRCQATCFKQNQTVITQIQNSWTVKER